MRVNWRILGALLAVAASAGCSATAFDLRGVRPLNLNSRGDSTPVIVRVYRLSDAQAFSNATLDQLWVNNDTIKHVMIGERIEQTVLPGPENGPTTHVDLGDLPGSAYVGIMALYGKEHETEGPWRLVLKRDEAKGITIELRQYKIQKSAN